MKTCLIVEDSRLARQELSHLLEELAYFEKILLAENAEEALQLLNKHQLDVVFLDIHLPGMNGFDFLESLNEIPPIIFTTAYDQYAIKSFEYNAIDYLLKPIKKERLEKAILKIKTELEQPASSNPPRNQIFIRDGDKCWFAKLSDIRLIESVGNYSRVYFEKEKPLLQRSLNYLENALDTTTFFRANRQQIINLNYIRKLDTWFNGKLKLTLTTGEEIEVSRRRSQQIKELFSI